MTSICPTSLAEPNASKKPCNIRKLKLKMDRTCDITNKIEVYETGITVRARSNSEGAVILRPADLAKSMPRPGAFNLAPTAQALAQADIGLLAVHVALQELNAWFTHSLPVPLPPKRRWSAQGSRKPSAAQGWPGPARRRWAPGPAHCIDPDCLAAFDVVEQAEECA